MNNPTNTLAIIEALKTVSAFIGEDAREFTGEMLSRKQANEAKALSAILDEAVAAGNCTVTDTVSLRTAGARTDFDSRVLGMLGRNKGSEVTAANLMERYETQTGSACTSAQMRASLNRLIESGDVDYSGIQRGTKYSRI